MAYAKTGLTKEAGKKNRFLQLSMEPQHARSVFKALWLIARYVSKLMDILYTQGKVLKALC